MPSILVLLPVLILALGALTLSVIAQVQPTFRSTWLIAVGFLLLGWATVLLLRWLLPPAMVVEGWLPFGDPGAGSLQFQIDSISWPYALSLTALLVSMIVTASARLQPQQNPWPWAGSTAITAMGLLAVVAGNPLTLTLAWTAIDIVELIIVLNLIGSTEISRQAVVAFAARVVGTLIVLIAILYSLSTGGSTSFTDIQPTAAVIMLIAAGLRLGVLPLHLPYSQELPVRRGLGTMMRLVAAASSLVLLARLPSSLSQSGLFPILLGFSILAGLYGAAMWLASPNELQGRPYWLVSLASLAVACSIQGQPAASIAWGVGAILTGGSLFLFSARSRTTLIMVALSVLAFSGLPFTPTAAGWTGLFVMPFQFFDLFFSVIVALLLAGLVRHAFEGGEPLTQFDRWVQTIYPLGLLALPINFWLIAFFGPSGSLSLGLWWAGLAAIGLSAGIIFLLFRQQIEIQSLSQGWFGVVASRIGRTLAAFLSFGWLYQFIWSIYQLIQRLINFLTGILEGEGGVLWALVLLALLVSILSSVGAR